MGTFKYSGGVEIIGFISPTDPSDQYPVIDPLYGIDGFRNVNTLSDLNNIPDLRRRAGMVVGVSGGTTYYKLNPSPWIGNISDWSLFQTGGDYLPLSGGTVSGGTDFTSGLTANTLTVNGVQITGDTYTTGGTYNNNGSINFNYNTGAGFTVTGLYTGQTSYVNSISVGTGLSANTTTGVVTIINTEPDQQVTITGGTNINISGTYPNFGINFTGNTSGDYLPLSGGTVTGSTTFTSGITANTIYATTYQNLPVSGLTAGSNINVSGSNGNYTISVTGITGGSTFTGGTVTGSTIFTNGLSATTVSATTYQNLPLSATTYVSGGTYSAGTITFTNTSGGTFNVTGLTTGSTSTVSGNFLPLSGGTVTGATNFTSGLTANTLNVNGINITGDTYVTGGTYNFTGDTLTLNRNDGNNVPITGFTYERQSDYVYPYFYGGTAPLYTLTSTSNWIIKRVDYTTPGSPITQSAIGSWDDRYTLTYS